MHAGRIARLELTGNVGCLGLALLDLTNNSLAGECGREQSGGKVLLHVVPSVQVSLWNRGCSYQTANYLRQARSHVAARRTQPQPAAPAACLPMLLLLSADLQALYLSATVFELKATATEFPPTRRPPAHFHRLRSASAVPVFQQLQRGGARRPGGAPHAAHAGEAFQCSRCCHRLNSSE